MREGGRHEGLGVERTPGGEHLVTDHAQGVDVAACRRALAERLLRGEVLGGSEDLTGLGERHRANHARDAEVCELGSALGGDHDVCRLHVPMNDAALMSGL